MIWDGPNSGASQGGMPEDHSTVQTRGAKTVSGILTCFRQIKPIGPGSFLL
jgi:hypothetical protein